MKRLVHKLLYRILPLEAYLGTMSRLFFLFRRLGIGKHAPATEYMYHLGRLVRSGDTAIDIGANLGYYARPLAEITGPAGHVYAVEPMPPVLKVLRRNLRGFDNAEILPYALGECERPVSMANDSASRDGYLGTGQNFVKENPAQDCDVEFRAEMRRGTELFAHLGKIDFIKCDIEGYEVNVMREMRPLIERHHPTVLIETGGENRPLIIAMFHEMGYRGFTLRDGREEPLAPTSNKDIIFRYAH